MAKIHPFRAVRPTRDKAGLVASRPYEDYSPGELQALLEYNPYSFLHIINPGYKFQHNITGDKRFHLVKNRYLEFKEENIFMKDEIPSYYIYRIISRSITYCGIIAAASIEEYENNLIKKHEDTIALRENLFKEYLKVVGFNTEPVLLTYPDSDVISRIIDEETQKRPEYEFSTFNKELHYLWKLDDAKTVSELKNEFAVMTNLYIADGHHRSASSYLLAQESKSANPAHTGEETYNYFMSFLIPESELKIYEFSRLVKDLNGQTKEEFLIQLDEWFRIENRGHEAYYPSKKHHFSMYLDGEFYSLYLRRTNYEFTDSLSALDTYILYKKILKPVLGIEDLGKDSRIAYIHCKNDLLEIKSLVDKKDFAIGFGMLPLTIGEIKKVADEGLTMPPKSTYIEPKLRSGLTIYEF